VAVRDTVQRGAETAGHPLPGSLKLSNFWLAIPPGDLHQGVWDVVALAAVAAMDKGRCVMWQLRLTGAETGKNLGRLGAQRAQRHFWELLHDFASLGKLPHGNLDRLSNHPFLCQASLEAGRMRVHGAE
jgi:hypothetical protein